MSDYQAALDEYFRRDDAYRAACVDVDGPGLANARADSRARYYAAKEARFVALNKLLAIKPPKPEQEAAQ